MIGERILRLRRAKGLSLEALASMTGGITKQAINKYEHGLATPSSDNLIRLARALDVKVEYFFRTNEVELREVSFRTKGALSAKEISSVTEIVRDALERYLSLEQVFPPGELSSLSVEQGEFCVESAEDAEGAAEELRSKWELGLAPIENLTELLEDEGIRIVQVSAAENFDGLSGWADGRVPFIAISSGWDGERQRFTMAHELGHLVMGLVNNDRNSRELHCHRFAAAFLVPAARVAFELRHRRKNLSYAELIGLKKKYGLSMQAWIIRARDLGFISEMTRSHLFKDMTRRNIRIHEPEPLNAEIPSRFRQLLFHAMSEGLMTEAKAGDLLGVSATKILAEFEMWSTD